MATIKYWDGSAWQYAVVGKQGPVGPTGPTGPVGQASLQRFRFVATGGETSLSGTDANGNTLAYTSGLEEVFLNGVALVRGQDYTATNGTSITGLTALVASDVVEILAWGVFNVSNTISNTLVDAKGDLLVGSAADTVSRLAVGSANQVLTVDSSTATGLKWATPAAGALTKISSTTFSNVSTQDIDNVFTSTYNTYLVIIKDFYSITAADDVQIQMRYSTTTQNSGYYGARDTVAAAGTSTITGSNATAVMTISDTAGGSGSKGSGFFYVDFPDGGGNSSFALIYGNYYNANSAAFCNFGYDTGAAQTFTGFRIKTNNNNFYGTVVIYGLEK